MLITCRHRRLGWLPREASGRRWPAEASDGIEVVGTAPSSTTPWEMPDTATRSVWPAVGPSQSTVAGKRLFAPAGDGPTSAAEAEETDRRYAMRGARQSRRPFSIQRWRALGYEITTDVFELQLEGLNSWEVAIPLGAALRDALATKLGVESTEMGVSTAHTLDDGQVARWSVLVFDKCPGGAGFSGRRWG